MGSKLLPSQREKLPKSDFACPARAPGAGSYPINDPARVASAKAYYKRKYTAKCKGGKTRICRRAKKFGMLAKDYPGSASWRKWCRQMGLVRTCRAWKAKRTCYRRNGTRVCRRVCKSYRTKRGR